MKCLSESPYSIAVLSLKEMVLTNTDETKNELFYFLKGLIMRRAALSKLM